MPGYIKKKLSKYKHPTPRRPQHSPYPCVPKTYGKSAQDPIATNNSPTAGQEGITRVQKVVGNILYYARLVESTPLVALNTPASEQAHNNNKHEPHVRLFSEKSKCTSQILFIQHDFKRSLRCVLTFSKRRQESCRWTFLTRLGTRQWSTHPPKRSNTDTLHNPQVRRSIRSGSWVRRNVFKWKRSEKHQTHTWRTRPYTTPYPHALW